jgi:hypothetical protein
MPSPRLSLEPVFSRSSCREKGVGFCGSVSLGFGLAFYVAFRLFLFVLVTFLIGLFIAASLKYRPIAPLSGAMSEAYYRIGSSQCWHW